MPKEATSSRRDWLIRVVVAIILVGYSGLMVLLAQTKHAWQGNLAEYSETHEAVVKPKTAVRIDIRHDDHGERCRLLVGGVEQLIWAYSLPPLECRAIFHALTGERTTIRPEDVVRVSP